jgi:hypothetical protein
MLIDIFSRRYSDTSLAATFEERDRRLLVQIFRIIAEDIYPYYDSEGKEDSRSVSFWKKLHDQISRELGIQELSQQWFSYNTQWNGNTIPQVSKHTMLKVCENWFFKTPSGSADEHVKDRISLIELGFRMRESEINEMNSAPISSLEELSVSLTKPRIRVPGNPADGVRAWRARRTEMFKASVTELNTRFRQSKYLLNYHNGYIQITTDDLVQNVVENPFWQLVANQIWQNVDTDMKEALDVRDSNGRDAAFYAARALESTIKIISDRKGWTQGKERGAHNYIDNLASKSNNYINPWESANLKEFFTHVRNPFSHGAGSAEMPSLTPQQTEWAIEFSMSWIKRLIRCM